MSEETASNVCVIVPNWNGRELIAESLRSLESQAGDIVVVDNGSTDGSVEFIKSKFPDVVVLGQSHNLGFAGGVNVGLRYAEEKGYEFAALFNNDAVAKPDWLKCLLQMAEKKPRAGAVTSKIMYGESGYIDSTGEVYTIYGMPYPRGRNEKDTGQYETSEQVFAASGAATLYRTELFRQIGLFDEDFFAYFEDVDVSFRARLAGWEVWYQPAAVVYHKLSATSSRLGSNFSYYHTIKNFLLLRDRNMPLPLYLKYLPRFGYQLARMFGSSIKHLKTHVFLAAVGKGLILVPRTLWIRWQRRSIRRTTNTEIDALLSKQRPPRPPEITQAS